MSPGEGVPAGRGWLAPCMSGLIELRIILLALCSLLISCGPTPTPSELTAPALYHWQTTLDLTDYELRRLDSLGTQRLYVKAFDVDVVGGEAQPSARLRVTRAEQLAPFEFVPTVFITNRTFQAASVDVDTLAARMHRLLLALTESLPRVVGYQIDCDWSGSTRERYFAFLTRLQDLTDLPVSATIRLHQLRYPERTGVPPVASGVLMYYNTGDLTEADNSILDNATAEQYLVRPYRYTLPLEVALPIFSWGVVLRDATAIKLVNDLQPGDLVDTSRFEQVDERRYRVVKSTYLDGLYLYRDDVIRLEWVTPEQLTRARLALRDYLPDTGWQPIYYHLDERLLKRYTHAQLRPSARALERAHSTRDR